MPTGGVQYSPDEIATTVSEFIDEKPVALLPTSRFLYR
jgi:hypothetical protein